MKILAIESSGQHASVALIDGEQCIAQHQASDGQPSRDLLRLVQQTLAQGALNLRQLDAIAFGRGPGSFTSLRVATALAQGLAVSANLPIIPISTLSALAFQAWRVQRTQAVIGAMDARLGELYWAAFQIDDMGQPTACHPETVSRADALASLPPLAWFGIGSGWLVSGDELRQRIPVLVGVDPQATPLAQDVAQLARLRCLNEPAQIWSIMDAQPVYLRDQVAHPAALQPHSRLM